MQIMLQNGYEVMRLPSTYRAEEKADESGKKYGVITYGPKHDGILATYASFQRAIEVVKELFEKRRNASSTRGINFYLPKE